MSPKILAEVDNEATDEQLEEIQDHVDLVNYLIDEGFIRMEVDDEGEVRVHPND